MVVMTTPRCLAPLAAAAVLAVGGCGAASGGTDGQPAGDGSAHAGRSDGGVHVAVAFYPLEFVTHRVGGDRVDVTNLTRPGTEPHDLELDPRDVAGLTEADLVVYLSDFQPAVDDAVAAQGVDALDVAGPADLSLAAAGDQHAGDQHAVDPHFWLDPLRLAAVGDAVAARLAEADPPGAPAYRAGAQALHTDLAALDAELDAGLRSCAVTTLVSAHSAFGYLADRYGLTQVGIGGLSPDSEPDPRTLARVAELVADRGVTTVYAETLVDPAVAETVAAEAGARTAVLDPVEGLTDSSAGDDYLEVMRANLDTLREGQSCR
jgi:zinc transport system substrate-binding protein